MYLIVGLGNPGEEYERTRHNLGFMLVDKLAAEAGVTVKRAECLALVANTAIEERRALLVKPQTYMNLSGDTVGCLLAKYQANEADTSLLVVSDDLALPFGSIRLRGRGSAGGHNGLKSIIGVVGNDEFMRLRIGIQPDHPVSETRRFVLSEFSREEKGALTEILERSAEAVRSVIRDGIARAMSLYN
jgi:peptidyl-tRNA hydrolase, PTH1 family